MSKGRTWVICARRHSGLIVEDGPELKLGEPIEVIEIGVVKELEAELERELEKFTQLKIAVNKADSIIKERDSLRIENTYFKEVLEKIANDECTYGEGGCNSYEVCTVARSALEKDSSI